VGGDRLTLFFVSSNAASGDLNNDIGQSPKVFGGTVWLGAIDGRQFERKSSPMRSNCKPRLECGEPRVMASSTMINDKAVSDRRF
jgi:hypothetical protein